MPHGSAPASRDPDAGTEGESPLDALPCPHPVGSDGRILTLGRRASAGLSMYHPRDSDVRFDRAHVVAGPRRKTGSPKGRSLPQGVKREGGRYRVQVCYKRKTQHVGYADTVEVAEKMAIEARERLALLRASESDAGRK